MNKKTYNILGTSIDLLSKEDLNQYLDSFLNENKGHYIVTPNPEIVLLAEKDKEFQNIINKADLSLPDGIGLIMAGWLNGVKITRHTGSGLVPEILEKAEKEGRKVMLINLLGGLSTAPELKEKVLKIYPELKFAVIDVKKDPKLSPDDDNSVKDFEPQIIFATLGMVAQEKLIANNLKKWPTVRLAMAVGGSFELLTGKIKKPPVWMHKLGLEWVWRVIVNPKRFKRPLVAVPTFMYKVIVKRIKQK